MSGNISEEYVKKGFVVIKNLVNSKDVERYIEIAKRYNSIDDRKPTVDYFYDYLRFFDFRLYPKFLKWINLNYYKDCFFLISKSKENDWMLNMASINEKKKICLKD